MSEQNPRSSAGDGGRAGVLDAATERELASLARSSYAAGVRRSDSLLPHFDGLDAVREALAARGITDIELNDGLPPYDCAHAMRNGRQLAYLDWTLVREDGYRDPFFPEPSVGAERGGSS